MDDLELKRRDLVARMYQRVCFAMVAKSRMRIKMKDPVKGFITLLVEPHYVNMTWDQDFFMIAKRIKGNAPYGERNRWDIIFLKEVYRYKIMDETFHVDAQSFADYMLDFGHTVARPSQYETSVCALPIGPTGECTIV